MGLEELSHECTTLTCGSLRMGLCKLLVKNRQNENKSGVEQVSPLGKGQRSQSRKGNRDSSISSRDLSKSSGESD
ncbi:hypothetical protein RRG08_063509 [Elysia crispata]|uniref:Uncharacterized protein n=1 Tax=Elysia crispata TaxID=231223 RepID=A0AAE1B354_9GAST|nr:hypothetical protein RRG08_063509 [Elysia crispata]